MNWELVWPWLAGEQHQTLRIPGVPTLLLEHLLYTVVPLVLALVIALPIGAWVGHVNKGGTLAINVSNAGRAIPSLGIILIAYLALGRSLLPVFITLAAMAIPPILTNTYIGVREVDPEVRDAAAGVGLSGWEILRAVELPLALPIVMAGIRTSAVQIVATATLAAYLGFGGLGRPIFTGLAVSVLYNPDAKAAVIVAVVLVALFAIVVEQLLGVLERALVGEGIAAQQPHGGVPPAIQAAAGPAPQLQEQSAPVA